MKNACFKLAFPACLPQPGQTHWEVAFWVVFVALHVLLGTTLVALLPCHPPTVETTAMEAVLRPMASPHDWPGLSTYLPPGGVPKSSVPGVAQPVGIGLSGNQPVRAQAAFPFMSGCP